MKSKFLVSVLLCSSIWAWDVDMDQLLSLDMEQLQDIKVVTATKNELKIKDVPSNVRVITDKMIKERGYLSLEDALADLPGMQFRNIQGYNNYTFIRGAPSRNNLILVMVDGVVINEINSGGFYGGNQYNLSNVKRIEVMYGPASALYGSNAVSGVINLITYTPNDEKEQGDYVSVLAGSFNTKRVNVRTTHYDVIDSFGYTFSAMYNTTDKTDLGGDAGANNWSTSMENFEENIALEGKILYKDFELGMIFQDKQASATTDTKSVGETYLDSGTFWHIVFANVWAKHKLKLGDDAELNSMLYYRNATVKDDTIYYVIGGTPGSQVGFYRPNSLMGIEERLEYQVFDNLELTTGLVYEEEKIASGISKTFSSSYLLKPEAPSKPAMLNNNLKSLYLQGRYFINEEFTLTAGIRHEDSSYYDTVNTPRSSLVFNKDDTTIKLIYAEAFRSPRPWDYNFGTGNSGLLPEEMKSYELYVGHRLNENIKVDMTYFNNKIDNKLTKDNVNNRWINQGKLLAQGIELSLDYVFKDFKSFFNYTYTDSEDENGFKTDDIAKHTANAGLTYKPNKNYLTYLGVNYVGKRKNPADIEDVDAYTVVNTTLSYNGFKKWKINLFVKNLLDEVYYHPSDRDVSKYRQAERSFFLEGHYKF